MNMHPAALPEEALLKECSVRTGRRGGPGGQHRNKVETAVVLTHNPTGTQAEANERRSQADNHRVALFRLRLRLACDVRAGAEECSSMWTSRTKNGKIAVAETHLDFPAMLAEAVDHITATQFDVSAAADELQVSASQLVKLLRKHPPALEHVNRLRDSLGFRKLR